MTSKAKIAEWFVKNGFTVIPLEVGGKRPRVGWQQYQESGVDEEQVDEWWGRWPDANVGVLTGFNDHRVIVVDADTPEAQAWCEANLPRTYRTLTPRGVHYWLRVLGHGRVANGAYGGLDIRGWGGYVVAPGSEVNGVKYEHDFPTGLTWDSLPVLDQSVLDRIERWKTPAVVPVDSFSLADMPPNYLNPEEVQPGTRNVSLASFVGYALKRSKSKEELWGWVQQWNSRIPQPLDLEEVRRTVSSIVKKQIREHGQPVNWQPPVETGAETVHQKATHLDLADYVRPLGALATGRTPMNWLIQDFLTDKGLMVITAPTGMGKSLFAWEIAGIVAGGGTLAGRWKSGGHLAMGKVLIIDGEMNLPVLEGRARLLESEGENWLDEEEYGPQFHPTSTAREWSHISVIPATTVAEDGRQGLDFWDGGRPNNSALVALVEYLKAVREQEEQDEADPCDRLKLIIFDNAMSLAAGIEENEAREVTMFMKNIGVRLRAMGYAVIMVHHSGKDETKGARGSSAWTGFADVHITLTPYDEKEFGGKPSHWQKGMTLTAVKNRIDARIPRCGLGFWTRKIPEHGLAYLVWETVVPNQEVALDIGVTPLAAEGLEYVEKVGIMDKKSLLEIMSNSPLATGDPDARGRMAADALWELCDLGKVKVEAEMVSKG